jgi:hypothetical protein
MLEKGRIKIGFFTDELFFIARECCGEVVTEQGGKRSGVIFLPEDLRKES